MDASQPGRKRACQKALLLRARYIEEFPPAPSMKASAHVTTPWSVSTNCKCPLPRQVCNRIFPPGKTRSAAARKPAITAATLDDHQTVVHLDNGI